MELSRQKKQSTIQEISYMPCPFCRGRGIRPSLEYTALTAYRKIETQAVKGLSSEIKVSLPYEVADYLLNQKRSEIVHLESEYEMSIHISGNPDMAWDECRIETTKREAPHAPEPVKLALETEEPPKETEEEDAEEPEPEAQQIAEEPKKNGAIPPPAESQEPVKKKSHRRSRHRRKKPGEKPAEAAPAAQQAPAAPPATATPTAAETKSPPEAALSAREPVRIKPPAAVNEPDLRKSITSRTAEIPKSSAPTEKPEKVNGNNDDPLQRLKKVFETLID
jgi:ribonuclease E